MNSLHGCVDGVTWPEPRQVGAANPLILRSIECITASETHGSLRGDCSRACRDFVSRDNENHYQGSIVLVRFHAIPLRLAACLSAALLAYAAVADNEASCPDEAGVDCVSGVSHHGDEAPPTAPARDCASRPCRTPVRVAPAGLAVRVLGTVSTFMAQPARPPISAEPAAPPTPPPVDRH